MDHDTRETAVVQDWHDAVNAGDLDRVRKLVHDDVEIGGPRGAACGADRVRDWVTRTQIRIEPERWFQQGQDVVVAQRARWRAPESGELGAPHDIACAFRVRDGRVQRVVRYDSLPDALSATGLPETAEVTAPPRTSRQETGSPSQVIVKSALPYVGSAHELEGYLHGEVPVSLIFFDGPPGSGPRLHRHPYPEIFVIQEGQATFTVGDETIEVAAGQIVIGPANIPHKFINSGDGPLLQLDIHTNDRFITEWLDEGDGVSG
jgi:mannose-6-phosphate isomerase-like protein (cupin superfamily)